MSSGFLTCKMSGPHQTGKKGEAIAAAYLEQCGHVILETNWRSNHQELDIIARKDGLLLIIEVKARSSDQYGEPEISVNKTKQRMLIKAANHYLAQHKLDLEVRFDIISILFKGSKPRINHIKDAFYPTLR